MHVRTICLLGGTGFVGRHICGHLADRRVRLRVLTRNRERHKDLLVIPNLELVQADPYDPKALAGLLRGMDCVINLIAILNEGRPGDFQRVHVDLPRRLVEACRQESVRRILHMSALGASEAGPSDYQRSKAAGEALVLGAEDERLHVTSFRPSVIFGPGDHFLSLFAGLLRQSPGIMPLPTPDARFQPVYVNDVAEAMIHSLEDARTFGRGYELGGPRVYTLRELVEYTARISGHRRSVIGLPDGLSRLQGKLMQHLPGKPYTYDNYLSSTVDNVCRHNGLPELGVPHPTALEAVAPNYLADFARRRYDNVYRRHAGDR